MDSAFDFGASDPQDVNLLGMDTSELIPEIKIDGLLEDFDPGFMSAEYLSTGSSSPSSSAHGLEEVPLFPEDTFENFDNLPQHLQQPLPQPTQKQAKSQKQATKEDLKRKAKTEATGGDHGVSPRPKKRALSETPTVPTVDELAKQGLSKEEIKKKRRMMKNRQSASISRRRKKEYLESLESRNRQLLEENVSLKDKLSRSSVSKEELERHKQRIQQLEAENAELRKALEQTGNKTGSAVRAGTTLMVCMLCFGLFAQNSNGKSAIAVNPAMHTGRSLKSALPLRPLLTASEAKSTLDAKDLEPVKLEKLAFTNDTDSSLHSHEVENATSLEHEVKKEIERRHDLLHASEIVSKNQLQSAWSSSLRVSGGFPPIVKELVSKTPESSYVLCSECVFVKGRDPSSLSLVMPSGKQQLENGMGENSFIKLDCQVSHSQVLSA